jgi:uncharacterized ion transporter superfamily protein YfcC
MAAPKMFTLKMFPEPLTILMGVIVLAVISTWLLPAGTYSKLLVDDNKAFVMTTPEGDVRLTQNTLDDLSVKIPVDKFCNGDIHR